MLGILLIDKPQGLTSHDVVDGVRKMVGTRRVGHAGTLDPMATGVLVVAVGPATRFLQYLPLEPKEYVGEIQLGIETDTQDAEGRPVADKPVPPDAGELARSALPGLTGTIDQLPPMYSALKREGRPLYDYARKGQDVERTPRRVVVHSWDLGPVDQSRVRFRVVCSGGTYVRTLAHDLGRAIGCGAHLASLCRTKVGRFALDDCIQLEDVCADRLVPLSNALPPMPLVPTTAAEIGAIREGRSIPAPPSLDGGTVAITDPEGRVVAAARIVDGRIQPECVIPSEALNGPV